MLEGALRVVVEQLTGNYQVTGHSLGIRFAEGSQLGTDGTLEERNVNAVRDQRLRNAA
jgi:hypothetical protein